MNKKILILGHPRGATKFISKLFIANGIDLQHEKMGKDGTVNWQFAVKADYYPYTFDSKRQDYEFEKIYHIIRKPIDSINTIVRVEKASEFFRKKYVNLYGNDLEKAILSYSAWHKLIHSQLPDITFKPKKAKEIFSFAVDVPNNIGGTGNHSDYINEKELQQLVSKEIFEIYIESKEIFNKL